MNPLRTGWLVLRAHGLSLTLALAIVAFCAVALWGRLSFLVFLNLNTVAEATAANTAPTVMGVLGMSAMACQLSTTYTAPLAATSVRPWWLVRLPTRLVQVMVPLLLAGCVGALPQDVQGHPVGTAVLPLVALAALATGVNLLLCAAFQPRAASTLVILAGMLLSFPQVLDFEMNPLFNREAAGLNAIVGGVAIVLALLLPPQRT
ncbi:hypothetical protein JT358_03915 [Micrococcales bacterium 31B]|nr:hypothetical protein [Micrococcales bacterium 31B]